MATNIRYSIVRSYNCNYKTYFHNQIAIFDWTRQARRKSWRQLHDEQRKYSRFNQLFWSWSIALLCLSLNSKTFCMYFNCNDSGALHTSQALLEKRNGRVITNISPSLLDRLQLPTNWGLEKMVSLLGMEKWNCYNTRNQFPIFQSTNGITQSKVCIVLHFLLHKSCQGYFYELQMESSVNMATVSA